MKNKFSISYDEIEEPQPGGGLSQKRGFLRMERGFTDLQTFLQQHWQPANMVEYLQLLELMRAAVASVHARKVVHR